MIFTKSPEKGFDATMIGEILNISFIGIFDLNL